MESSEAKAKTHDESIAPAVAELGLSPSVVEVVPVKTGKTGIFGFGSEELPLSPLSVETTRRSLA